MQHYQNCFTTGGLENGLGLTGFRRYSVVDSQLVFFILARSILFLDLRPRYLLEGFRFRPLIS